LGAEKKIVHLLKPCSNMLNVTRIQQEWLLPCDYLIGGFNHLEKYEFVNGKDYPIYYGKIKMH